MEAAGKGELIRKRCTVDVEGTERDRKRRLL